ncbi:hypothetical protein RZA67_01630 [Stenotrophomonas sp. C3(2023)]|uniref:hypothetical protein n=1 Tax=Stenotrophomonas sp. C3(2023) TaxID=3080277 RepID=UPI00293C55C4|nr:hypothetical protein [Stenotrophomonas sp. C3(2023)]MDV3467438.1 hypothetical protein [Stenotrophomonas sp. C3(2023)]
MTRPLLRRLTHCALVLVPLAVPAHSMDATHLRTEVRVEHAMTLDAVAKEVPALREWVTVHAPGHPPRLVQGQWRLQRTMASVDAAHTAMADASSPLPLPDSGRAGEQISTAHASGEAVESWAFRVPHGDSSGRWDLMRYDFNAGAGGQR